MTPSRSWAASKAKCSSTTRSISPAVVLTPPPFIPLARAPALEPNALALGNACYTHALLLGRGGGARSRCARGSEQNDGYSCDAAASGRSRTCAHNARACRRWGCPTSPGRSDTAQVPDGQVAPGASFPDAYERFAARGTSFDLARVCQDCRGDRAEVSRGPEVASGLPSYLGLVTRS